MATKKTLKKISPVTVATVNTETGSRKFMSLPNLGTPILDRVLVKEDAADEYSAGGIIIPDNAKEKPSRGRVYAAGPGKSGEEMVVKPGDVVLYGKYAGTEVKIKGQDYLLMRQNDILMIIND